MGMQLSELYTRFNPDPIAVTVHFWYRFIGFIELSAAVGLLLIDSLTESEILFQMAVGKLR